MAPHLYPDTDSPLPVLSVSKSTTHRHRLPEDVIMRVFQCYRLDSVHGVNWNLERWWHKLTHVCSTWRKLILSCPSHLDLHLVCTYRTPIIDMLALSPPFRLIINYPNQDAEITTEDEEGLLFALRHRKRVGRISLTTSNTNCNKVLADMDGNFPELRHLRITSGVKNNHLSILPATFRAPHLTSLTLIGPAHPTGAPLSLTSITAIHLVHLKIGDILPSPNFHPEYLVVQLSSMPLLATVSLGFRLPIPKYDIEKQLLNLPRTRITLSHLTNFSFLGVSPFLEGLLARISASLLEKFDITFFNQLTFALPHLSQFISTTPRLKLPVARVHFKKHNVSVIVDSNGLHRRPGILRINVGCQYHDWQVETAAQICNAAAPVLSVAQELTLRFRKHGMSSDDINLMKWHDLLRPFTRVEVLRVHSRLVRELSHALQLHDGKCPEDVLPQLYELVLSSRTNDGDAIVASLNSRQTTNLIRLRLSSCVVEKWIPRSSIYAAPKVTSIPPSGDTSHTSRNSSTAADICARHQTRVIPEHHHSSAHTGPEGRHQSNYCPL
jgi:hypothetical protein